MSYPSHYCPSFPFPSCLCEGFLNIHFHFMLVLHKKSACWSDMSFGYGKIFCEPCFDALRFFLFPKSTRLVLAFCTPSWSTEYGSVLPRCCNFLPFGVFPLGLANTVIVVVCRSRKQSGNVGGEFSSWQKSAVELTEALMLKMFGFTNPVLGRYNMGMVVHHVLPPNGLVLNGGRPSFAYCMFASVSRVYHFGDRVFSTYQYH